MEEINGTWQPFSGRGLLFKLTTLFLAEGRKDKVALSQGVTASNNIKKEKDLNDQRKVRWQKVASKTISRVEPAAETRYKHLLSC